MTQQEAEECFRRAFWNKPGYGDQVKLTVHGDAVVLLNNRLTFLKINQQSVECKARFSDDSWWLPEQFNAVALVNYLQSCGFTALGELLNQPPAGEPAP